VLSGDHGQLSTGRHMEISSDSCTLSGPTRPCQALCTITRAQAGACSVRLDAGSTVLTNGIALSAGLPATWWCHLPTCGTFLSSSLAVTQLYQIPAQASCPPPHQEAWPTSELLTQTSTPGSRPTTRMQQRLSRPYNHHSTQ
jgi:hypothetical protein